MIPRVTFLWKNREYIEKTKAKASKFGYFFGDVHNIHMLLTVF